MKAIAMMVAVAWLAGCSGNGAGEDLLASRRESPCPATQTMRYGRCVFTAAPEETANSTPQCHPVAAQAYQDWAIYGDGGPAAGWCAAACQAICAGSPADEADARGEAAKLGMACNC